MSSRLGVTCCLGYSYGTDNNTS